MTETHMIRELGLLISKIARNEELVVRAQDYYNTHHEEWDSEVAAYFLDVLARKRDMIEYEWDRVRRMGEVIAAGREYTPPDF